ncbi:MAG: hypothetical protein WD404_03695 [Solirubrobacterales bacterium]
MQEIADGGDGVTRLPGGKDGAIDGEPRRCSEVSKEVAAYAALHRGAGLNRREDCPKGSLGTAIVPTSAIVVGSKAVSSARAKTLVQ